jgi:hypothetical protein
VIAPIDQAVVDTAIDRHVEQMEDEGWLAGAEEAFSFWDNQGDAVWDNSPVK